jgi:hypothetical protein
MKEFKLWINIVGEGTFTRTVAATSRGEAEKVATDFLDTIPSECQQGAQYAVEEVDTRTLN